MMSSKSAAESVDWQRELGADHQSVAVPEQQARTVVDGSGDAALADEVAADLWQLHPRRPAGAEAPGDAVEVQPDLVVRADVEGEQARRPPRRAPASPPRSARPRPDRPHRTAAASRTPCTRTTARPRPAGSRRRRRPAPASPADTAARPAGRPNRPATAGWRRCSRRASARAWSTSKRRLSGHRTSGRPPDGTDHPNGDRHRDSASPAAQPTPCGHRQMPSVARVLRTGDADRVDPVAHLEVDDRGLGQRPVAPVHRQHVAEVDEGDLQGGNPRSLLTGTDRSRGQRRVVVVAWLGGDLAAPSPPSSRVAASVSVHEMSKDPSYTHPSGSTWNTSTASQFSMPMTPGDSQPVGEPGVARLSSSSSTTSSSSEADTRPSCRTPTRRRTAARRAGSTPVSAASASAEHTGAGWVTTASESITVGTAAVSSSAGGGRC